jgi:hypothetical protein
MLPLPPFMERYQAKFDEYSDEVHQKPLGPMP